MIENIADKNQIALFAKYDFLDLCLLGETGTGKSHTARLIHNLSPRAHQTFIAVNCAELSPSIIEAVLFGYEKGAFTGALNTKEGKFEAAVGGTLFLDEIGELPPFLQAKLLKVVEEKQITRVGSNLSRNIDVRLIYATHRDLSVLREDLRYRIGTHSIYLKPLRERREEIIPLGQYFLAEFNRKSGSSVLIQNDAWQILEKAEWRGNIRELRTLVERACMNALYHCNGKRAEDSGTVKIGKDLLLSLLSSGSCAAMKNAQHLMTVGANNTHALPAFLPGEGLEKYLNKIEKQLLGKALATHQNNQTRAARELGISRSGLIKKLKRFGH